jgi:hypothetical protein
MSNKEGRVVVKNKKGYNKIVISRSTVNPYFSSTIIRDLL